MWENDGLGSWSTQRGCFSFCSTCCATIELCNTGKPVRWHLEHPRQGETGTKPWQNWSAWTCSENWSRLHQKTQPHWEKRQILLWQDHECTSRYNSVHDSHLEAGRSFRQARLSYPNFLLSLLKHVPFILDVRNQIFPISLAFFCVSTGQCFPDRVEETLVFQKMLTFCNLNASQQWSKPVCSVWDSSAFSVLMCNSNF